MKPFVAQPAPTLRLRPQVGRRYELIEALGSGGMGEVWSARHLFTRRRVALKLIRGVLARKDPDAERRFFEEAALQAAVCHSGVVDVLDAGREPDGSLFLAMDLLEGQTLERAIRQKRLDPRAMVRVMVRVLDALAAVHAVGIVHRDIKPSNIFLARSTVRPVEVKLLDFGIAVRSGSPPPRMVVGTLDFMSPEQARGEATDARADIFSASAVLYRGLAGRAPFNSGNHGALLGQMEDGAPSLGRFRSDLPGDLIAVIDRGLALDPAERWGNAEDMAQALLLCDRRELGALVPPSYFGALVKAGTADMPPSPWDEASGDIEPEEQPTIRRPAETTVIVPRRSRFDF